MVDDGYLVAELFGGLQHMGGKQHGIAGKSVFFHHFFQHKSGIGIQSCQRFIQDPDGRIVKQGSHDHDLLAHAVGIGHDPAAKGFGHVKTTGQ